MLRPRIVVCLLIEDGSLVKTKKFKSHKYLGDPLNAIKIFNELEVDELCLLDISATKSNKEPDFSLISKIAKQCRMPFSYGGGIKCYEDAKKIISSGVEKILLGDIIYDNFNIISEISRKIGSQSTSVILNYKKDFIGNYKLYKCSKKQKINININNQISAIQNEGAGEIVFYNIDKDGTREGLDILFYEKIYSLLKVPSIITGGCSSEDDISNFIKRFKGVSVGAGSFFTLYGKHEAPLINYNNPLRKSYETDITKS